MVGVRAPFLSSVVLALAFMSLPTWASTQQPSSAPSSAPAVAAVAVDDGIPVRSELVRAKCGTCHLADAQQRMARISYRRASPENWELTIKRMVNLNKVALEPTEARAILKYLADNHGLAPEEALPMAFESERRIIDFKYTADASTQAICTVCHSVGRAMSERRTKEEWGLLLSMHRGYYPGVDNQPMNNGQGFRRNRPPETQPGADGRVPDNRHPMDKVIEHMASAYPLKTPQWVSWSAAVQPGSLAGRWGISGHALGKGPIVGEVVITAEPASPDTFSTETTYTIVSTGQQVVTKGSSTVYTGFQWRGRTVAGTPAETWREVMFVARDRRSMTGRWFTGAYHETGLDVTLTRIGSEPLILGTSARALQTSSRARTVEIYGANFPASIAPTAIALGQGVTVDRIVRSTPTVVAVEVSVAADAPLGPRDIALAGAMKAASFVVYDKVHRIAVAPQAGLARVGGAVVPKQMQQFEAVGFHAGPDGASNTADDWNLGLLPVTWSVEEHAATFGDDDLSFVGELSTTGLFTPNIDGPNPERSGLRNNIGDIWVVAQYSPAGGGAALRGRAHLLVSVPTYMHWQMLEVGK
jgi:quinohemoprotein amine dehydrogenase